MSPKPAFLLDQDVYEATYRVLVEAGHDCTKAAQLGLAKASDEEVLAAAHTRNLVLITRDKGFGALVYAGRRPASGLILLRMSPGEESATHDQMLRMIAAESAAGRLSANVFVVEPDKYRVRPVTSS